MTAPAHEPQLLDPLTERQRLVLSLIAKGYTNPQIADELGVTIDGAKWHVREILSKLGVGSREEAGRWWREQQRPARRFQRALRGFATASVLRWAAASLAVMVGFAGLVLAFQLVSKGDETPAAVPTATPTSETATASTTASATAPASGAFQRHDYAPGETLTRPGIYFVDTTTGAVEGWSAAGPQETYWNHLTSRDSRLVVALGYDRDGGGVGIVADRTTGGTWEFDTSEWHVLSSATTSYEIVSHEATFVLSSLETPGGGRLRFINLETGGQREFQVPAADGGIGVAVLSPDGKHLVFQKDSSLWWLDVDSGTTRTLVADGVVSLSEAQRSSDLVLRYEGSRRQVLTWDGTLRDYTEPDGLISPDGQLLARWRQVVAPRPYGMGGIPVLGYTEVVDARTQQPAFRVLGALFQTPYPSERWLADSSGIVVSTTTGYFVVSSKGEMSPPLLPESYAFGWPIPSPDDPDLFAVGIRGFVRTGSDPVLVRSEGLAVSPAFPSWGAESGAMRLELHEGGKDWGEPAPLLAPVIQRAPFDGPPMLLVANAGDCLNVRDGIGSAATIVGCYPDGTPAEPTEAPDPLWVDDGKYPQEQLGTLQDEQGMPWIHIRLPDGVDGWASAEYLAWRP